MPQAVINARTSGKYTRETINGVSHIVTTMMPIRGNTAMNGIYYPDAEVSSSFMQLNNMLAPSGHPVVGGVNISAAHPVAINQNHIGAFLRNPRKKGPRVFVDYVINEEIAANSEDGRETVRRIEEQEKVGVSTGLGIQTLTNAEGADDFGAEYKRSGSGFSFDHVATLLNEAAAGEHAGTELILNEDGTTDERIVCNMTVNELSIDELRTTLSALIKPKGVTAQDSGVYAWVRDILPDSKIVIYELTEGGKETYYRQPYAVGGADEIVLLEPREEIRIKTQYEPVHSLPGGAVVNSTTQEGNTMDEKLVLALIAVNSRFSMADKDRLMALSESEFATEVSKAVTVDEAKQVLNTAGVDLAGLEDFETNKDAFAAFKSAEKDAHAELVGKITAVNSDYTSELLAGKSTDELGIILNMAEKSTQPVRVVNGKTPAGNPGEAPAISVSFE